MGADSSIYSLIKPVQQQDSLAQYGDALKIKALMGQGDLQALQLKQAQQSLDDDAGVRQFYANLSPADDPRTKINELLRVNPKAGMAAQKFYQDADKAAADLGKTKAETGKIGIETTAKAMSEHRDALANVTDPQTAAQWVMAAYNNPHLSDLAQRSGSPQEAIARIPQDPQGFQKWIQQNALGMTKFIEMNKPTIHMQNTGGASNVLSVPGLGGAPTTLSSTAMTATPGERMTDARARERLAFDQDNAKGQVLQTNDGTFLVDTRGASSRQVMGPDGKPLAGKQMKDIPQSVLTGMMENNRSINKVNQAIAAVSGDQTAVPDGMIADKNAVGLKGYLPNVALNRIDPKGTDTRALIADIGSLKIHDRSGAAVTASESPRLMPFIPLATDNAETVAKKLNNFKREYELMQKETGDYYNADNGFKPYKPATSPVGQQNTKTTASSGGIKFLGFE